jgi:N utilization substance protein B
MSRKIARRYAFELIFQLPFQSEFDPGSALDAYPDDNLPKINANERGFVIDTISGVCAHLDAIDRHIAANSEGWAITRLNSVDLAVLRLAVYEMLYTDTPIGISVNEAVDLAKMYSGEEAGGFVNGVLAKVSKQSEARHA